MLLLPLCFFAEDLPIIQTALLFHSYLSQNKVAFMAQEIFASSTSSTSTRADHGLFVSFYGEDTGSGFIGYLFDDLKRKGILTYGDDKEHPRGEPIWTDQVKAIKKSRVATIVFSKNYASSERCLNELVESLKLKRSLQQTVLPVFYDVRPSDVREQKGSFAEALFKHEELFAEDKVKMWRDALTDAANLSGWYSKNYRYESKLIEEIVEEISQKLELPLPWMILPGTHGQHEHSFPEASPVVD